ncbi:hypothetical protein NKDENANG_01719 [Candidatus Entotheonellaceae bacterium PAL068K]
MESSGVENSSPGKDIRKGIELGTHIVYGGGHNYSRYKDPYLNTINVGDAVLFKLVVSDNEFSRRARKAINQDPHIGDMKLRKLEDEFKEQNSPVGKLNNIFEQVFRDIQISIGRDQTILASKNGVAFEASQLSDGERNALILSCHILCAPEGTVFYIDEPEQHFHRAVAPLLLSALIDERYDCAFVIFTHEMSLVEEMPEAEVLVLHGCDWQDESPIAWDHKLLKPDEDIPNDTRRAILGGRKRILFVEGEEQSLDCRLYRVIYPALMVHPVGGCTEVIRAVRSLKSNLNLHWVEARGIIDRDGRDESEVEKLKKDNVSVLSAGSVESLFYGEAARNVIAKNKARELGEDEEKLLCQAVQGALDAFPKHVDRFVKRRCHDEIRKKVIRETRETMDLKNISKNKEIEISFPSPFNEEKEHFNTLLREKDLDALIERYPVKESEILDKIANAFHYKTRNYYENAVLECVKNDKKFRQTIKDILPNISFEDE